MLARITPRTSWDDSAVRNGKRADVRFGSKADIDAGPADVRFTPESGHRRETLSPQSYEYSSPSHRAVHQARLDDRQFVHFATVDGMRTKVIRFMLLGLLATGSERCA